MSEATSVKRMSALELLERSPRLLARFTALPWSEQEAALRAIDPGKEYLHRATVNRCCVGCPPRWLDAHKRGLPHAAACEGASHRNVVLLSKLAKTTGTLLWVESRAYRDKPDREDFERLFGALSAIELKKTLLRSMPSPRIGSRPRL